MSTISGSPNIFSHWEPYVERLLWNEGLQNLVEVVELEKLDNQHDDEVKSMSTTPLLTENNDEYVAADVTPMEEENSSSPHPEQNEDTLRKAEEIRRRFEKDLEKRREIEELLQEIRNTKVNCIQFIDMEDRVREKLSKLEIMMNYVMNLVGYLAPSFESQVTLSFHSRNLSYQ